jgi:hypothetical protein
VYDYLSPRVFRVSTTAFSLGTNTRWSLPNGLGIQTTGLAGLGYAAAQTLMDSGDYHYGLTPQGSASLRLTAGNRLSFDVGGRGYLISDVGGYDMPTSDVIIRGDASLGVRLYWRHAVSLRYSLHRRDASAPGSGAVAREQRESLGVFYTLLGPQGFGATRRH